MALFAMVTVEDRPHPLWTVEMWPLILTPYSTLTFTLGQVCGTHNDCMHVWGMTRLWHMLYSILFVYTAPSFSFPYLYGNVDGASALCIAMATKQQCNKACSKQLLTASMGIWGSGRDLVLILQAIGLILTIDSVKSQRFITTVNRIWEV